MNDTTRMRDTAPAELALRHVVTITAEQITMMIRDHYRGLGLRFHESRVTLRVHGTSGGGFSYRAAEFDGATIRLAPEDSKTAEAAGLPTVFELTPATVAAIVAGRVDRAMDRDVPTSAVKWDVSDAGGTGIGMRPARLTGATIAFVLNA